jgi:DNA-binding transcriptional regulator YiaG
MTPKRMAVLRGKLQWSRGDLAALLMCSRSQIAAWETGVTEIPEHVGAWLQAAASWLAANPPPDDWRVRQRHG